jgi:phosphate transport system protein
MNEHISSAYDRDLEGITTLIMRMGGLVEEAILKAVKSLAERDVELAEEVRAGDKMIDALELQINEEAARTIALRAPVSKDLRSVLTVLRLAASLERIGDYAKNIAKRTSVLVEMSPVSGSDAALRRMAREVEQMLKDTLDAYVRGDADLAEDVRQRDQEVDQMYNLHFMAKNIERMGDLTTNMAEQVIYLVTGEMPEEARPKEDQTAFVTNPS